jgi:hypothetical protein
MLCPGTGGLLAVLRLVIGPNGGAVFHWKHTGA